MSVSESLPNPLVGAVALFLIRPVSLVSEVLMEVPVAMVEKFHYLSPHLNRRVIELK